MITFTFALLILAAGILAGCFTGKVFDRLDNDDVTLARVSAICFAVLTTAWAILARAPYSAVLIGAIGLALVRYCVPLYKWAEKSCTDDSSSGGKSSWMYASTLLGTIVAFFSAFWSVSLGLLQKLAMIPGTALAVVLCFGAVVWSDWLIVAVIALAKKVLSAKFFNHCANNVAESISRHLGCSTS